MKSTLFLSPFLIILFFATSSYYNDVKAQNFSLDDPRFIFKDKKGNIISRDSAKALARKGSFGMSQEDLGNGKIAVVITPESKNDIDNSTNINNEWIKKWKNTRFPDFKLKNLKGELITNADTKGKYVVVNFWFTNCKPCIGEIPELNKIVEKYKGQPIVFLAPALDSSSILVKFSKSKTFTYTILASAKDLSDEMAISSYPTHVIIDKEGNIKEIMIGVGSEGIYDKLDSLIQKVIGSKL